MPKYQGNVKGMVYPVTQKPYTPPDEKARRCAYCGKEFTFDPEVRLRAYCSHECKRHAHTVQQRASYDRRKWRAK